MTSEELQRMLDQMNSVKLPELDTQQNISKWYAAMLER